MRRAVLPTHIFYFCLKMGLTARNVKLKAYFAFLSLNLSVKSAARLYFAVTSPCVRDLLAKRLLQRQAKFSILVANPERPSI
ncbi:hypothetical protein CSHOW_2018 [Campylobacter showae]|uniref:Uncharacterized protein n=1 Tax=Campylobacter showae RM3277 TaxID=553219 RepID=C6RIX9_9BACT|nr:hypothetical protein CAMSH0001_0075 [Campylobacter showae RM3277]QCD49904.1 hypothetical protein CSHOW_2018 [Campylobacter showae]